MLKILSYLIKPKRPIRILLIFCLIFIFLNNHAQNSTEEDFKVNVVVIDPGHGGKDSGALGKKSKEKDIVLAVALKLGKYIEEKFDDVKVIYTRKTDEFIPLYQRAEIANQNNADLFISIHANGWSDPESYGTETLVLGLHRGQENFEVAKRENSVILLEDDYSVRYEKFDPESQESYVALALMQREYFKQSIDFAKIVQDQFRERTHRKDRGVKQQGLLVLAQTAMPGVLVETGFVSNRNEEKFLISEEGQDYIASAIFRAFRDYKIEIESKSIIAGKDVAMNAQNVTTTKIDSFPSEVKSSVSDEKVLATQPETPAVTSSEQNNRIKFKVQITASSKSIPLNSEIFKEFNDIEEFRANNMYKYAVGELYNYSEIVEYSKWVRNRFPDAFVIALKNGEIIPVEQALKEIK
ncbi:MAG: N-acetylmuramoyl-L-alanine amidase [Bacteroidales bacterium]|nr:N-acetylmuramoyl-L-alanine amidase [Bacteroidales bacterium]